MIGIVRKATAADVPSMVELSEQKRTQYEHYQPLFWRKAQDSRERQAPFLAHHVGRDNVLAYVMEREGDVVGFVIASLVPSPPVYDAGITCIIDDYCVTAHDWSGTGAALLQVATNAAKARGALQAVVVCGHLDEPKRELLRGQLYSIASEWYVKPL